MRKSPQGRLTGNIGLLAIRVLLWLALGSTATTSLVLDVGYIFRAGIWSPGLWVFDFGLHLPDHC